MKHTAKKILCTLLVMVMCLTVAPLSGFVDFGITARALEATGSCGENVTYTYDSATKELVISGTGTMTDYSDYKKYSPFYKSDIKSVVIEDGVTTIGDYAFKGCTSLESVTIPDSVTSIGRQAFENCTSLESITIPDSVVSIDYRAFYNTGYYKNTSNWEDNVLYIGKHLITADESVSGPYTIKDGTKIIANYAFYQCSKFTSITIPNSVTSIGTSALRGCKSLASVTIGDSVTSIGSNFSGCGSLNSIKVAADNQYYSNDEYGVLFNKDKTILVRYPAGNTRTTYIIPDSVTSIGDDAFLGCTNLESVTIPDSVTSIGDYAFSGCKSLESVTIPGSVTSTGNFVFRYCDSLESVTIGDGVTSIGEGAFEDCTSLESVTIPDSVTSIGFCTFAFCESLESITIPDRVKKINLETFTGCKGLKSIIIPDSVTSIGGSAFRGCTSLTDVYYDGTEAQWNGVHIEIKNECLTEANIHFKDPAENCSCNCHKEGFRGFIWKLLNFFYKLFRTKSTCACGVAHY